LGKPPLPPIPSWRYRSADMEKLLTCVVCPVGCRLVVDVPDAGDLSVSGNRCSRGEKYAQEEFLSPRRTVTATCGIAPDSGKRGRAARVPVRTTQPFPKEKIPELLAAVYRVRVELPVKRGDAVIRDFGGTGIDVVATRTVTIENET
jgi:CxxC motif-containing protein